MARYFLDSSALVKRYHHESGSLGVEALFNGAENRIFISRLALVELHSTFARLVREGLHSQNQFDQFAACLNDDVAPANLRVAAVTNRRLEEASTLLRSIGRIHALRTLDAIHLATALALHGRGRFEAIVAADKRLRHAAVATGLPVLDVS
ncbi:MAG: type II toxin-antitoxin system VapC family toxin [Gemmataceae bacterium]